MDFALTEDQVAVRDLARRVFTDRVTGDRLKEVEAGSEGYDRALWKELGSANLLGVALPEDAGGSGYGLVELGLVLEEAAAAAAPVPIVPSVVLGALPIAAFGTPEQKRLLPEVSSGDAVLSAALAGVDPLDTASIPIVATSHSGGWRLHGSVDMVPLADTAARILVPARSPDDEIHVFLVEPAAGMLEPQEVTTGRTAFRMQIDTEVSSHDALAGGLATLRWIVDRGLVALSIMQVGIGERALRLTAEYVAGREQFERPLATFQAVQQRIADAYIDVLAMRWTSWRAMWRLAEGLPADEEIAVAKFWASDAGPRVLQAAQHLHGGMGVDVDYPLHRYTKEAKAVELTFGGAMPQLERLGDLIAT